jgi:hypothetical protein
MIECEGLSHVIDDYSAEANDIGCQSLFIIVDDDID